MANKKKKIAVKFIAEGRVICIKPRMLQEKKLKKEEKNIYSQKSMNCSGRKKRLTVREYRLKRRCQSNYRSALQRQLQKQQQPRFQHFQQNKF